MTKDRGDLIRKKRKELGLSMDDLARAIGVTRGFICLLEKGKSGITAIKAQRLAAVLGVPFETLFSAAGGLGDKTEARWLAYLTDKYKLSQVEQTLLSKFVRDAGLDDESADETVEAFHKRWEAFYKTVCAFLPNPMERLFADSEVRQLLVDMGFSEVASWRVLRDRFDEMIAEKFKPCDYANGGCWRKRVEDVLGIDTLRVDEESDLPVLFRERTDLAEPAIMGGAALVMSSGRMLGAIYHHSSGRYVLIEDRCGDKAKQRDFSFWHEAVRVLIDPGLKHGRGVRNVPDGLERTPLERLICRLSIWFAFGFVTAGGSKAAFPRGEREMTIARITKCRDTLYSQATLRMVTAAVLDAQSEPMAYVDASLRLKHPEQIAKGIRIEEVEKMRQDPDAKLRIGYAYANLAAEETGFGFRMGMRVAKKSPIYEAYVDKKTIHANDDLAVWDYDLTGKVRVDAAYGKDGHVHAVLTKKEGGIYERTD